MDRIGPRRLLPGAAAVVGIGALLFATGNPTLGGVGRFLQGAGGVFALVGAIYIATKNFSPAKAATLIGATQMFGMAGGSAGQFVVGPIIGSGVTWNHFWITMGVIGLLIGVVLYFLIPDESFFTTRRRSKTGCTSIRNGLQKSSVNPVWLDCGIDVHPHNYLRHDLGRPLSTGSSRPGLQRGSNALGHRSFRLDHRLSSARSSFRSNRST